MSISHHLDYHQTFILYRVILVSVLYVKKCLHLVKSMSPYHVILHILINSIAIVFNHGLEVMIRARHAGGKYKQYSTLL